MKLNNLFYKIEPYTKAGMYIFSLITALLKFVKDFFLCNFASDSETSGQQSHCSALTRSFVKKDRAGRADIEGIDLVLHRDGNDVIG